MSTQEAALDRCFAVMHRDPWYYCTKEQGHEGLHANPTSATPPLVAASPVPPVVPDSEALDPQSIAALATGPDDPLWRVLAAEQARTCPRCQGETETSTFGYSCACQGHCGKVGCSGGLRSGSGVVPDSDDEVQPLGLTVTGGNPDGPYNVLGYPDDPTPRRCPRCNSPSPALHPAVQSEGEVQPCGHSFHFVTRAVGSGVVPDKPALATDGRPASMFRPADFSVDDDMSEVTFFVPVVPAVTDDEAATAVLVDARLATKTEMRSGFYEQVPRSNAEVAVAVLAALRSAGFLLVRDHTKET